MNNGQRIALPNQQPMMNIAMPINDVQLVALIAAQLFSDHNVDAGTAEMATCAVAKAREIFLASVTDYPQFAKRIQAAVEANKAKMEAEAFGERVEDVTT